MTETKIDWKQKKLAVVGVSENPEKYGHRIFRDLLAAGYQVTPIHPSLSLILEQPVYPSLSKLPFLPDLVITVVPPVVTLNIAKEAKELGVPLFWMQPGSESQEVIEWANEHQLAIVFGRCFMKAEGLW